MHAPECCIVELLVKCPADCLWILGSDIVTAQYVSNRMGAIST
jgi:hypothetical protein